ncbi:MAG: 3-hydroxyacyl-ACP dehydratase [Bacteroidetes bacterium]|nr:3-hydroxyacyl-ACP dehydratase [Bacteroidota bacterium]
MLPSEYDIITLIPQKAPFVMVDKLLHVDEKSARSLLHISKENIFVEEDIFREPGLIENIAQTAAARSGYITVTEKKLPLIGYIGDVKNLEIAELPKVDSDIETEITIENQIFDITVITGRVIQKEKVIASCEMKIFISQPK